MLLYCLITHNKGTTFFSIHEIFENIVAEPALCNVIFYPVYHFNIAVVNRFFQQEMIQDTMFRHSCLVISDRSVENVGLESQFFLNCIHLKPEYSIKLYLIVHLAAVWSVIYRSCNCLSRIGCHNDSSCLKSQLIADHVDRCGMNRGVWCVLFTRV